MVPWHLSLALFDIFSGSEMTVILLAVLIFFGGDKMPGFARGLGKALREFRKAANEVEQEIKRAMEDIEHPMTVRPPPRATLPHRPIELAAPDPGDLPADPPAEPPAAVPPPTEHPRSQPESPGYGLD